MEFSHRPHDLACVSERCDELNAPELILVLRIVGASIMFLVRHKTFSEEFVCFLFRQPAPCYEADGFTVFVEEADFLVYHREDEKMVELNQRVDPMIWGMVEQVEAVYNTLGRHTDTDVRKVTLDYTLTEGVNQGRFSSYQVSNLAWRLLLQ